MSILIISIVDKPEDIQTFCKENGYDGSHYRGYIVENAEQMYVCYKGNNQGILVEREVVQRNGKYYWIEKG